MYVGYDMNIKVKNSNNNCLISIEIIKMRVFQNTFKFLKITPVNGHYLKTAGATESYKSFSDTV